MRYALLGIFLLSRIPPTLANSTEHGTYAAMYFTGGFAVAAIDSRTTDSSDNVISDSVCKLHPLSNDLFFFDLGLSHVPQFGQKSADLEALAEKALVKSGKTPTPRDLAKQWIFDVRIIVENIPDDPWNDIVFHVFDPLQNNRDHMLIRGIFVGKIDGGDIGGSIAEVRLTGMFNRSISTNIYDLQDDIIYSFGMDPEYSIYKGTHAEPARTTSGGEWPDYLAELVQFMIDGKTRRDVGGSVAALMLLRGRPIEWTRRPAFCPD